ncbi:MAG: hypothetical protein ACRELD_03510 [Longimicrobiales bacterium]
MGLESESDVLTATDAPHHLDGPEDRPGVPMQAEPRTRDADEQAPRFAQPPRRGQPIRSGLARPTPVFGTPQPIRGLSGVLRRVAYRVPEHHGRHWLLLMLADRVDVLEGRIGPRIAQPFESAGLHGVARRVRRNPLAAIAGFVVGGAIARELLD